MQTTVQPEYQSESLTAMRSAQLSAAPVPRRVLVAPWGEVESTHGSFIVDEEAVGLVVSAFKAHGTDLPIDYEHQTLGGPYAAPNGQAPAAGWIKALIAEPGVGLVADIEWTGQAEEMLTAKSYRYLSPVAIIRKRDRKLVAIHSVALTNKPAIVGMQPIVNGDGAVSDASAVALLKTELDLPAEADAGQVLVAASERLTRLREEGTRRVVEERVTEALRAGKLVEAQRAWAEALVAREADLFEEWLKTAPVIVQPGRVTTPLESVNAGDGRDGAARRARAEYRGHPLLQRLTSEDAYVADAVRAGDGAG